MSLDPKQRVYNEALQKLKLLEEEALKYLQLTYQGKQVRIMIHVCLLAVHRVHDRSLCADRFLDMHCRCVHVCVYMRVYIPLYACANACLGGAAAE